MSETTSEPRPAPRFLSAGDAALVVEFGNAVDPAINHRVMRLGEAARAAALPGLVDLVPTLRSLMVHYDPTVTSRRAVEAQLRDLMSDTGGAPVVGRLWEFPTLYGEEMGPDLEDVAKRTGLTPERVVELHAGTEYEAFMMGFMPGLAYLGIIPPELELPRRSEPRVRVPAGSVAIATNLTNVYSLESPGGWHLLGRTPVALFDLHRDPPVLLQAGDRVRFVPVGRDAYEELRERMEAGDTAFAPVEAEGRA
jgi:KipI family sensor histidine kinase inhibitor